MPPAPGGPAIATAKNRKTRAPAKRRPARSRSRARTGTPEQPLGVGVADGFALNRLAGGPRAKRGPKKGLRELSWAAFGEVARALAGDIARRFRPAAVVGIAKGGVFVGGALSAALGAEFYPVRIEKRRRDAGALPTAIQELPSLAGKKVLVVDDVASTGATLARARALARKAGAKEVRTAVLVARPRGARPDFCAFATDELMLFAWDYHLDAANTGPVDPGDVGV
jgi:hypoxanthine phosphoribosyltransferase